MNRLRLLAIASLAVVSCASLTACADKSKPERFAHNEGIYFESGPLKYQVQITRQLNPRQVQDAELMQGVPLAARTARPNDLWFATFLRIENETDHPQLKASQFTIRDTNGDIFHPIAVNAAANSFAYEPGILLAGDAYPNINSIPGQTDKNGKMLLFKLPLAAIALRPLVLTVTSPTNPVESGRVNLDI